MLATLLHIVALLAPLDENLLANLDRHLGKVHLQYLKHKVNLDVEGSAKK